MTTLSYRILEELLNFEIRYKGGTRASLANLIGLIPGNKGSIKSSLTRLRTEGFIVRNGEGWIITKDGKEFLDKGFLKTFNHTFKNKARKDLLVMFDIPEECRHYRDWFREQLRGFGYVMIQQSVWAGPSPLPKEFKDYIKKLKLNKNIRTFKLARSINLRD